MMRGARVCTLTMGAISSQARHQSEGQQQPAPPQSGSEESLTKLASHVRTNEGAPPSAADAIRSRMQSNNQNERGGGGGRGGGYMRGGDGNVTPQEDPTIVAQRTYRDSIRDTDSLGGQYHKDYYRDPNKGYAPQHAPRNFADGGKVDYPTSRTSLSAEISSASKADRDHYAQRYQQQAREARAASREMNSEAYATYAAEEGKRLQDSSPAGRKRAGVRASEAFMATVSSHSKGTYIPDQFNLGVSKAGVQAGARAGASLSSAVRQHQLQKKQKGLDQDIEAFRVIHGLRDQERHEAELSRRTARKPFAGYDADRAIAGRASKLYGQSLFDPLLPSGSMAEAQTNLRKYAVEDDATVFAKELSRNTVHDQPLTGEQLTQSLLAVRRLSAAEADVEWEASRKEALGIGRQGPLSQESGPDRRKQRLHKNDERILNAAKFAYGAYHSQNTSQALGNNSQDATERNSTEYGVGHLLRNKFDIDRRSALLARGKPDPVEGATMHYGIPIPQQIDSFIRTHRNAKGDRHLDYFTPFPTRQDMAIHSVFRDTEGFPLLKARPEFFEWELMARYRAHHQQRRQLALLHGLEPVPNETAQERNARRERLDQLCELTPFDETKMSKPKGGELAATANGLRKHFGAFFLPSPSIVQTIVHDATTTLSVIERAVSSGVSKVLNEDPLSDVADGREHLLSARYLNKLSQKDGYNQRIRGPNMEIRKFMTEPTIDYLPEAVTSTFSEREFELYQKYITKKVEDHEKMHMRSTQKRRWIAERNAWSTSAFSADMQVIVVDAVDVVSGSISVIPVDAIKNVVPAIEPGKQAPPGTYTATVAGITYSFDLSATRPLTVTTVTFDDGSTIVMDEADYHSRPLEVEEADPNAALNYGLPAYHYNRINYIETQDAIWEEGAYKGEEGWTQAMDEDGLRPGLPVLARRQVKRSDGSILASGEPQRAEIIQFNRQPFYNPNPRHVTVRFMVDGTVESVPLSGVYIWQLTRNGPERTVPDETRRSAQSIKRFVDVSDPTGQKQQAPHFLDRYRVASTEDPFRSVKQITDIDLWNINDESRADNHRPLTIAGRKNYVSGNYFPYYTPWDWIVTQEMETPLIKEQIRTTGAGDSLIFAPNRYWRFKRRGHGYVQNSPQEVRDLFRYVDQITPWKKAQKVRNLWEVRQHHPFPKFHRPEVAMHRNNPGLLPSHLWDLDKKTGKVKALKDSVSSYQTLEPYPKWVQL